MKINKSLIRKYTVWMTRGRGMSQTKGWGVGWRVGERDMGGRVGERDRGDMGGGVEGGNSRLGGGHLGT